MSHAHSQYGASNIQPPKAATQSEDARRKRDRRKRRRESVP